MVVRSLLPMIAVIALGLSGGAFAHAGERPHRVPASKQGAAAHTLRADRDPYADPAAPCKADRLASPSAEPIVNLPGSTVLTREVLDDMNATTLRDALRATPGVTIGR
jgi:outer membrane receptor for monomeric catechols